MTSDPRIIDAATVVVARDSAEGLEVLLLRRHAGLTSHGGLWAFPGGAVDPGDRVPDADDLASARRAAARETHEEVGLKLDPAALVPLSHWTSPDGGPRIYRTWFLVGVPDPDAELSPAADEVTATAWYSPAAAVQAHARGDLQLPVPQFVTLDHIGQHASVDALLAALRGQSPHRFNGRRSDVAGGICWRYEGDEAWDHGDLTRPGRRRRMWAVEPGWRFEET
ncbi:MAG: hypothetical protein JWN46_437 [Acidimicrobiales bacterium]|nr:hypothetical protein [Acidimicrobiales bacterium]